MSWALEAIEKAAMERARHEMVRSVPTMMGFTAAQVTVLESFFYAVAKVSARGLSDEDLLAVLRAYQTKNK